MFYKDTLYIYFVIKKHPQLLISNIIARYFTSLLNKIFNNAVTILKTEFIVNS